MLSPKRLKFRKMHKGRIHGLAKGGSELSFGSYGLKALTPDRITARQIEAARRAITREMKRAGRLWIRIFPDVPDASLQTCQRHHSPSPSAKDPIWVSKMHLLFSPGLLPETECRNLLYQTTLPSNFRSQSLQATPET